MEKGFIYLVFIWLICVNIIGFAMAGLDKIWAIKKQWRLAEKWFFRMTAFGGGLGIFLGCIVFHHKIRNRAFMLGIPAAFLAETGIALLLYSFVQKLG